MPGEILDETPPILLIFRTPGNCPNTIVQACGLIVEIKLHCPRNHGVAVDLAVYSQREHEFHPSVEDRVVKKPGSINAAYFGHHRPERIIRLAVPRTVYQCGRDRFLAGVGEQRHHRPHRFKMLLAP